MKLKFAVIIQHERQGFSYMKGKDFHNKLQWKTFTFPPNQSKTSDGSARSKEKIPLPLTSFIGEVTASAAFSLAFHTKVASHTENCIRFGRRERETSDTNRFLFRPLQYLMREGWKKESNGFSIMGTRAVIVPYLLLPEMPAKSLICYSFLTARIIVSLFPHRQT